jgi:ferredoxin--NADP+ reductase
VALDVARLIARSSRELAGTDTHPQALDLLGKSPVRDIYIIGRRGPLEATFTPQELKEFGEMERTVPLVDAAQLPASADAVPDKEHTAKKKNLAILQDYALNTGDEKPVRVHFLFHARPVEILGADRVAGIRLERTAMEAGRLIGTGETVTLDVGLVVPAIGYRTAQISDVPFDEDQGHFEARDGLVRPRL